MKNLLILSIASLSLAACASSTGHEASTHMAHDHAHNTDCGHMSVMHESHRDYLHDGHMHHLHEEHVDEHVVMVSEANPNAEAPADANHHAGHMHSKTEQMHAMVPHGDHMDFLHDGHLHHVHGDHIDEHGSLKS